MAEDTKIEPGELLLKVLKRQGIMLPLGLLQQEFLIKMEEKIKLGYAATYNYLSELANNPDSTINKIECNNLVFIIDDFYKQIGKEGISLKSDDKKIIGFLSRNKKINFRTFLELLGPLQMISEIIKDSEKGEYSKVIKTALVLYIFQNLYELILQLVDRYLYIYLDTEKTVKSSERFMQKVNRAEGEHALASAINEIFISLNVIRQDNDSIFRILSKLLRNKIAHFNLFYDSQRDKIVLPNGEELTLEKLSEYYKYLYLFIYDWMQETLLDKHLDKNNLEAALKEAFKEGYTSLFHEFRTGFRAGYAKRWGAYILFISEENENCK